MLPYSATLPAELFEAGRRAADTLNATIAEHGWWSIRNCWMAFKLADGTSDGILYDTKRDAVRHQSNERMCCYVCFRSLAQGARWKDTAVFIKFNRDLYDKGYRMPDPDAVGGGPQPALTTRWNDYYRGQMLPRFSKADMERLLHDRLI